MINITLNRAFSFAFSVGTTVLPKSISKVGSVITLTIQAKPDSKHTQILNINE
jgi:hypothetical protein